MPSLPLNDINTQHPLMRIIPRTWYPYAVLIRWDRPVGLYLAFLPALMGLNLAVDSHHTSLALYVKYCVVLVLGAWVMRSAGCICNDLSDRDIDPLVERTAQRPLANGTISVNAAIALLIALALLALMLLLLLPMRSWWVGVALVPMVVVYPLMKRFFVAPQLWLGITFTAGVWIGWLVLQPLSQWHAPMLLYLACIIWTVGYDTIYAMQDKADDQRIGLYSLAVVLGRYVSVFVIACYILFTFLVAWAVVLSRDSLLFPLEWRLAMIFVTMVIFALVTAYRYGVLNSIVNSFNQLSFHICRKDYLSRLFIKEKTLNTNNLMFIKNGAYAELSQESHKLQYGRFFRSNAWLGFALSVIII